MIQEISGPVSEEKTAPGQKLLFVGANICVVSLAVDPLFSAGDEATPGQRALEVETRRHTGTSSE